jgi:hypothetical protein
MKFSSDIYISSNDHAYYGIFKEFYGLLVNPAKI